MFLFRRRSINVVIAFPVIAKMAEMAGGYDNSETLSESLKKPDFRCGGFCEFLGPNILSPGWLDENQSVRRSMVRFRALLGGGIKTTYPCPAKRQVRGSLSGRIAAGIVYTQSCIDMRRRSVHACLRHPVRVLLLLIHSDSFPVFSFFFYLLIPSINLVGSWLSCLSIAVHISCPYCTAGLAVVRNNSGKFAHFWGCEPVRGRASVEPFPEFAGKFAEIRMAATPHLCRNGARIRN
ncbi:hypothetical protein [Nocardia sp. NPDC059195]|uniref:hypothetical protein n=1 Tax=Nocardia sp. NPDC059195 TaxID=3346765 RepID=UPI00367F8893